MITSMKNAQAVPVSADGPLPNFDFTPHLMAGWALRQVGNAPSGNA
jgi:hypothetical protein